jgi:mannose-1-phosphate guanylyltransferase/mannose-6-phosphate isomerase
MSIASATGCEQGVLTSLEMSKCKLGDGRPCVERLAEACVQVYVANSMPIDILPAIMSGGAGTRLWPLSTTERPKQFHVLLGQRSLIQETALRVRDAGGDIAFVEPMVLCSAQHAELVESHLAEVGVRPPAIVLEPMGRNTAATAALAAALAREISPGALVLLLPADHLITDRAAFLGAVARAAPLARERIVTFGITPTRPETGYGYIKAGSVLADGVHAIDSFREKPDETTAEEYLTNGAYFWNSGIFLFDPEILIDEFASAPEIRDTTLAALDASVRDGRYVKLPKSLFSAVPAQPLDIAVMEKTARGAVAPCDIGWADVGSWNEIWRLSARDENGNALEGDVLTFDATDNIARSDGARIVLAGVHDLVVIASGDTILIVPREKAQDVKTLCERAKSDAALVRSSGGR